MESEKFGRRKHDDIILHLAKDLIAAEKTINMIVDKLLEANGLTRKEVNNERETSVR